MNTEIKNNFIKKWRTWWLLEENGKEITEAFERDLDDLFLPNTEIKTPEEIEQGFKELDIYLNDIYDYYIRHDGKDAGNLWIQFSDKYFAFRKKISKQPLGNVWVKASDRLPKDNDTVFTKNNGFFNILYHNGIRWKDYATDSVYLMDSDIDNNHIQWLDEQPKEVVAGEVWDTIEKIVQNRVQELQNLHFTYEAKMLLIAFEQLKSCFLPSAWQKDHSKEVNDVVIKITHDNGDMILTRCSGDTFTIRDNRRNEELRDFFFVKPQPKEELNEVLPNLKDSTESLSKIKDKDQWLDEVRGNDVGNKAIKLADWIEINNWWPD